MQLMHLNGIFPTLINYSPSPYQVYKYHFNMAESHEIPSFQSHSKPCSLPSPNPTSSLWHVNPVLQGHRTTETLPSYAEYIIVGSGITGTSALRYLVESGVSSQILMLEAREACWGATGRVSPHIRVRQRAKRHVNGNKR
jgi:hypothetical protein